MLWRAYIDDIILSFRKQKEMAEKAFRQVADEAFFKKPGVYSNSIAIVLKHVAGNLASRWTDFLSTDGEKPWRDRDAEFIIGPDDTRPNILAAWENGWTILLQTLGTLNEADLHNHVLIRKEELSVFQAIHRSLTHTSYHVGQIVYLSRLLTTEGWQWITIPPANKPAATTMIGPALILVTLPSQLIPRPLQRIPLPRQNRVTPFGDVIATPERGTVMGNRGLLHDAGGRIRRPWALKRWIVCVLQFRGRKRTVMTPGRYTELFFLDEAMALAAGHRPCAECRRQSYNEFCHAWGMGQRRIGLAVKPSAQEIDDLLHAERLASNRSKRTFTASLDEMPKGVFVTIDAWGKPAYLVLGDYLLAWTPGGYSERRPRPSGVEARVLTPRSTAEAIRAGYIPAIHLSAQS